MEVKLLPKSVRETLRSEVNIRSVAKCIAQLVFNSIDAKSASIAVRINLVTFKIQVIDNGTGISNKNLKLVGFRHATSKYYSAEDLKKNPYIFPSRGEALASIIKLSETVKITTRSPDSSKTFSKVFESGKTLFISSVRHRPSRGTTIVIENFMYNLPVRKKSINQNTCLDEIKNEIECIALIHPNTSFSLRNDTTGDIIFHTYRSKYVFQTTAILFGKQFSRQLRKMSYNDKNFSISGLISLNSHAQNKIQFVYVNGRLVSKTKIHTLINTLISKSKIIKNKETDSPMLKQKHAAFIINIKCSYTELDIVDFIEPIIEFKNWETVFICVENAIIQFLKTSNLIEVKETKNNYLQNGSPLKESIPNVRTSQVAGVIRGIPIKRKLTNIEKTEQSITSDKSVNNEEIKVVVDIHSPPKKMLLEKLPSPQKPESIPKVNEKHNNILESDSAYGKDIIMDMFLKSTTIFRNDNDLKSDDLLTFSSAEKYTNRTCSTCIMSTLNNNCNKSSITTSTKISITETIEQNNNEKTVFKVPHTPKLPKRKRSSTNDSIEVSNMLAKDKNKQQICVPKKFQLDFIKNISESNNLPFHVTNSFTKLIDNFAKKPNRKNYECTIKITKRLNYLQSSDFLQPATKRPKYIPKTKFRHKNVINFKKEIVHANSMIKTYYDLKTNINNHHKMQYNNLSYLKNKNNVQSLRSTFKKECLQNFVPIYNIKRNNYHFKNNYKNEKYYERKSKVPERIKYDNHISFPSPQLLFKPFSTNPHLSNLFCKNNIPITKPNLYLNYNFAPPDKFYKNRNKHEFNSDVTTFESHQFTKNCYINKQNIELDLNDPVSMFKKPTNCLFNNQNLFQKIESKNKSETVVTEKSNITFLPQIIPSLETPIKVPCNINRNNENIFSNYCLTKITPENNNEYENSKKTVESNITFLPETFEVSESPIKISYTNRNNENIFSNCFQSQIMPQTTNKNENSKKTVESNNTFLPETFEISESPIKISYTNRNNENTFSNNFQSQIMPQTTNKNENSKKTVASNITFLPETFEISESPIKISYTNRNNENTFSNNFQSQIMPQTTNKNENPKKTVESNITFLPETSRNSSQNNRNYDNSNISNWVENTKKFLQSSFIFDKELNGSSKEIQRGNDIIKDIDNIEKSNVIKEYEKLNSNYFMKTPIVVNSKEIKTIDRKKKLPLSSSNYSSPIISCFSNRKISRNNNKNVYKSQQKKSNNEQLEKDSNIVSSVKFSSTSNLIQEKDISNIINALDKSIMSDTLKITNFEKRNCEENLAVHYTNDLNVSGTNSAFPVFQEDSSNIILENTKNIDEILNHHLSNDIPTNLSNIQQANNSEILNKTDEIANNLQSNSNLLSKNANESEENINKNESENDEYGNQMSEWIKQTSATGNSYYLNLRTGMTNFGTPRNIDGCLVTKRHSFMPKGMSPIMLPTSTAISKELSPKSKNILHETIANTENDELQTIKWINFLQNKDSKNFFNELYSNSKSYESEIPNINKYKIPKKIIAGFENYSFSKDDFNKVTIINQCDNKFIVTKIEIQGKYDLLVLFDQHAVHERIRLEKLLKDYHEVENKLKSVKCQSSIKLTLDNYQINMLQNYRNNFENWGIIYEIEDKENVIFTQIPSCWQSKDDSNLKHKEYSIIETLIMTLIQEESNWLRNIRTMNVALPLVIQNTIKTEACRTAVKFGDPLTKEQCENLINELLLCDLPFNCAHGRPTIVPVFDLNNINDNDEDEEINLNILKT